MYQDSQKIDDGVKDVESKMAPHFIGAYSSMTPDLKRTSVIHFIDSRAPGFIGSLRPRNKGVRQVERAVSFRCRLSRSISEGLRVFDNRIDNNVELLVKGPEPRALQVYPSFRSRGCIQAANREFTRRNCKLYGRYKVGR